MKSHVFRHVIRECETVKKETARVGNERESEAQKAQTVSMVGMSDSLIQLEKLVEEQSMRRRGMKAEDSDRSWEFLNVRGTFCYPFLA